MLFATLDASSLVTGVVNSDADISSAAALRLDDGFNPAGLVGQRWDGAAFGSSPASTVPDGPTLSDWRVALTLWGRMDDVTGKVAALKASSDPATAMIGKIATERLEYANNVYRAQLLTLKDAVGFTDADVDESLYRAHQVTLGDLSGRWPAAA